MQLSAPRSKLAAMIMGLCVIGDSMLYVTLPPSYQSLGLNDQMTGLILSVNRFSRLAFNPLAAVFVTKMGYKKTAVLCSMLAITCTLGYSVVKAPWIWLLLRVMWGLTWSLIRLTAMLLTLEESTPTTKGQALGFMQRLVRIGSVTGTFMGGFLLDRIGFRQTTLALGLVSSASIFLAISMKADPESRVRAGTPPAAKTRSAPDETAKSRGALEVASCFSRGSYVFISTILSAVAVGGIFLSTTGVLVKTQLSGQNAAVVLGITAGAGSLSGFIQSFRWLADILFAPQVGRLSDRFGRHLPMSLIYFVQCASGALIVFHPSIGVIVVACSLMYAAQSLALVILSSASADLRGTEHASIPMTLYSTCLDMGEAVGPILAYSMLGFGLFRSYALGTAALGVLGSLWAYAALGKRASAVTRTSHAR